MNRDEHNRWDNVIGGLHSVMCEAQERMNQARREYELAERNWRTAVELKEEAMEKDRAEW